MKKRMNQLKYWLCACAAALSLQAKADEPVLTISGGKVQGVASETKDVLVYKGIPYAAPPVGDLRWKAPQPVIPWMGVLKADKFGAACIQADQVETPTPDGQVNYYKEFYTDGDPVRSEDCLYLNVWTPASGKGEAKLPVAIWIHGGAFDHGYGYEKEFDGEAYAKRGIVLVTINYRLGLLGFISHPALSQENERKVSGNYGLLDQLAAIEWVRQNISQFGGDPQNITCFGQSAGAMSVRCLSASPLAEGKFQRAIIQSGGGLEGIDPTTSLADAEKEGVAIFGNRTAEELRALTTDEMQAMYAAWSKRQKGWRLLQPILDGYVLTEGFAAATKAGHLPERSYMLGGTEQDMSIFKTSKNHGDFSLERIKKGAQPAYVYHFARQLPGDNAGAFHSSELWYMFGTLRRCWRPFTLADVELSETMLGYWTNFMRTGDPNGRDLSPWAPYTAKTPEIHLFDIAK